MGTAKACVRRETPQDFSSVVSMQSYECGDAAGYIEMLPKQIETQNMPRIKGARGVDLSARCVAGATEPRELLARDTRPRPGPKPRWSKNENARFNYDLISPIIALAAYSNIPV